MKLAFIHLVLNMGNIAKAKTRVLIVDDKAMVREGLRSYLTTEPSIEVIGEAASGEEGVKLAQKLQPDIVLMDIEMPGELDGLAATRALKEVCSACDVLMLTFHEGQEYLRQALRSGASGYILKEVDRLGLINAVLTVANGGSLINPAMLRDFINDLSQKDASPSASVTAGVTEVSTPSPVNTDLLNQLTRREREVLVLMGEGLNNQGISQKLMISQDTVKSHVRAILEKLNVKDRTQAAVFAVRSGLVNK